MNILIYIAIGLAIANLCVITGIIAIVTRNWHISQKWDDALFAIMTGSFLWGLFAEYGVHENWAIYVTIVCYSVTIVSGMIMWLFPPKEISYVL